MKENTTMENAEMALKYKQLKEQVSDISFELGFCLDSLGIDDSNEYTDSKLDSSLDEIRAIFHKQEMRYKKMVDKTGGK